MSDEFLIPKSKALRFKYQALVWLRIVQRCAFVATEAGGYNSDVIGATVNSKKLIEIEVKVSLVDLKNDFNKYKHHAYFKHGEDQTTGDAWSPTHFYFMVPTELVEPAKALLLQKTATKPQFFKHYGIIDGDKNEVVKRAEWIHKRPVIPRVHHTIALRMGSELLRLHEAWL